MPHSSSISYSNAALNWDAWSWVPQIQASESQLCKETISFSKGFMKGTWCLYFGGFRCMAQRDQGKGWGLPLPPQLRKGCWAMLDELSLHRTVTNSCLLTSYFYFHEAQLVHIKIRKCITTVFQTSKMGRNSCPIVLPDFRLFKCNKKIDECTLLTLNCEIT